MSLLLITTDYANRVQAIGLDEPCEGYALAYVAAVHRRLPDSVSLRWALVDIT